MYVSQAPISVSDVTGDHEMLLMPIDMLTTTTAASEASRSLFFRESTKRVVHITLREKSSGKYARATDLVAVTPSNVGGVVETGRPCGAGTSFTASLQHATSQWWFYLEREELEHFLDKTRLSIRSAPRFDNCAMAATSRARVYSLILDSHRRASTDQFR